MLDYLIIAGGTFIKLLFFRLWELLNRLIRRQDIRCFLRAEVKPWVRLSVLLRIQELKVNAMPSLSITDIIVRSNGLVCHLNKLFTVSGARPGVRGMVDSLIGDKLLLLDISWLMQRFRYGVFNLHFRQ